MIGLLLAGTIVQLMYIASASSDFSQEIDRYMTTASNGVVVSITEIYRTQRLEFYSPVLEGESTDFYASRIDVGEVQGPLQLMGTSYYWGSVRHYNQAAFANGHPVAFKLGPVMVRQCDRSSEGELRCMWSEDFTITVTPDEIANNARDGMLEVEITGSLIPEKAKLTLPVAHVEAVIEVANAR